MKKLLEQVRYFDEDGIFDAILKAYEILAEDGECRPARIYIETGLARFVAREAILTGLLDWASHPEDIVVEEIFFGQDGEVVGAVADYRGAYYAVAKDEATADKIRAKYPDLEDLSLWPELARCP